MMDKDPEAIAVAEREFGARPARRDPARQLRRRWRDWDATAAGLDGVLFDLGVSSPQLDVAERGFSFGKDGPLDMRMDPGRGRERRAVAGARRRARDRRRAVDLRRGAHEPPHRARDRGAPRRSSRSTRTAQLADLIALGRCRAASSKIHPATRSFQAIRIFINRELADLEAGLDAAHARLQARRPPGGDQLPFARRPHRQAFIARHAKAPPAQPPHAGGRGVRADAARDRRRAEAPTPPKPPPTRARAAPCCASPRNCA